MARPRHRGWPAGRLPAAASASLLALAPIGCGGTPVARPVIPAVGAGRPAGQWVVHNPVRRARAWRAEVTLGGHTAIWTARRSGVTLMRLDQRVVHLALHAGSRNPGGGGWTYGDHVGPAERGRLVAAFNGGFKLDYGAGGFLADGRVAKTLQPGLASIVTYRNGLTQIGAWKAGVPARRVPIASVRQNLRLLVDHGRPATTVASCVQVCWGGTIAYVSAVARSALGIDRAGRLVWAAAKLVTPAQLARALISAGVVRALELDINPKWVAGYLYRHDGPKLTAVTILPHQRGIYGHFLSHYSRDFFAVLAG